MAPKQIDTLAELIATQLPSLILERTDSRPVKPANRDKLFIDAQDARIFLMGHLRSMGVIVGQP